MDEKTKCLSFDVDDAMKYGVPEAVFLFNLRFWLSQNLKNQNNIIDGYVWMYNTTEEFTEKFPFWSVDQVRNIIKKLKKADAVITGDYSKDRWKRSTWFTTKEFSVCEIDDENPCKPELDSTGKNPNTCREKSQYVPVEIPERVGKNPSSEVVKIPTLHTDNNKDNNNQIMSGSFEPDFDGYDFLKKFPVKYQNDILTVLETWKEIHNKRIDFGNNPKRQIKRGTAIKNYLADGYALEECLRAVRGIKNSPHHMGQNKDGKKWDEIENIFPATKPHMFERFRDLDKSAEDDTERLLKALYKHRESMEEVYNRTTIDATPTRRFFHD